MEDVRCLPTFCFSNAISAQWSPRCVPWGRPWVVTCYLADYPLWGEKARVFWCDTEPCASVLSSILVAEPNRSTAEAEETYVATTTWTRPTTWVAMVEARATEVDSSQHSKLQMELRRPLVDFNVDWILDWRSQRHLQLGSPRRPIARIAAGWSCSAGSAYEEARRLLWKEHTWWCRSCRMWLGMQLRASTTMTSNWMQTPLHPSRRFLICFSNMRKR